jgi:HSP20 family protein
LSKNHINNKGVATMKNHKILIVVIVVLALALVVESAYLVQRGQGSERWNKREPWLGKNQAAKAAHQQKAQARNIDDDPFSFGLMSPSEGWDPFEEMDQIQRRMNRLFRESMGRAMIDPTLNDSGAFSKNHFFEPDIDVKENGKNYVITLDLPGMDKDKINVTVSGQTLVISGERKVEKEETALGKFNRAERSFGSFQRSIPLPRDADGNLVNAEYQNGVLTITLPKMTASNEIKPGNKVKIA